MALLPCAPMLISDFDYELPDELIARFPPTERRDSRLLALEQPIRDLVFADLLSLLRPGDLLVFNDTRVIKARLAARKESGGRAEILIERIQTANTALAHVRASKSPKPGSRINIGESASAIVIERQGPLFALEFDADILPLLEDCGTVPLPPYLGREADEADSERYQTVYAKDPGAVAAPTAGLHFDEQMLQETRDLGVNHASVTLHVGAGTFQSLRAEQLAENRLHSERVNVSEECCEAVHETRANGGRVVAVGTTSVRALESASTSGHIAAFNGETELFIQPGYEFRSVDAMLTNFHLPKSSLLMLVAAFSGKQAILEAYRHAVREKYRFFSYGDAMFLSNESGS